ncbi:MAG: DinB family protein [Burkholderiales bacterium]|nr:DinB family protein [Bacteroidia bacterium]
MKRSQLLLEEVMQEAEATRNLLSLIPFDKADFVPHQKSMTLLRLATHVAEISGWWKECLLDDELDFAKGDSTPKVFNSTADIVALHDKHILQAEKILNEVNEDEFLKLWTMRAGEMIFFTKPKAEVARTWCMNHLYHHRGQLTVYLRLLNIPLPAVYATTADLEGK